MQIQSAVSIFAVCAVLYAGRANGARTLVRAPPEIAEPIVAIITACIQETKNNPEKIMTAIKENKVFEDKAFLKFLDCAFQKSGYANPDGTMNVEESVKVFPKEFDMKKVFENCNTNKGSTRAETTFKVYKCYQENSPAQLVF